MDWLDHLSRFWPHFAAGFDLLACLLASSHALLHKRDTRSATIWIGVIWTLPALGPLCYLALGVNRIRRRAIKLGVHKTFSRDVPEDLGEPEHAGAENLKMLARVVGRVVERPLLPGNQIEPLVNGDQAFPAMLAAIDSAKTSVSLVSYIFDNDPTGKQFVAALERAVRRGVAVRVLVDAAGTRYSFPPITHALRRAKIPYGRFLPSSLLQPWRVATINLRNHRKVFIVDGRFGFTGGMNIRHGNVLASRPKSPVQDLHFRVEGPVVTRLQEAFVNDWAFTTGEVLDGELWFPELSETSNVIARVITDGPDADFDKLRWTLLAALAEAQSSVQIVTPYFLPDIALVSALNLAALRGVSRGHHPAGKKQPAVRALGVALAVVAGAPARLPHLAHAAAVRPLQAYDRGRPLGFARLGQLGCAQPAAEFRAKRRVLRPRFCGQNETSSWKKINPARMK